MPGKVAGLLENFQNNFAARFQEKEYLLADTRIPWVSLGDHLVLTAAIAVAMTEELLRRGRNAQEICGINLPKQELRALACLCGFLHDIGKARLGETEYRLHVQRGVEYATAWLESQGVENPLRQIILGAVARHHLRDNPQTLLEKIICLADSYASAGDRPELGRAATKADFEKIIEQTEKLERELFGPNEPICLLLGDTDAIKSYVYETSLLPEIRGASQILQEVEEKIRAQFRNLLAEECLIYCGGGGLLAIIPASQAHQWKQRIEQLYLEQTRVATATIVVSDPIGYADVGRGVFPYDDARVRSLSGSGVAGDVLFSHFDALLQNRTKRKNFGELVAHLTGRLQQAKRSKTVTPFFETLPPYQRCQSCGKRAAEHRDQARDEWLCSICWQRRSKGRGERRSFIDDFLKWARREKSVEVLLKDERGDARIPADLDTLAAEGKIALIYADGNNMGDFLQFMPSPASYRHFSEALADATKEALYEAIWRVFGHERLCDPTQTLPFEIIALGGDDVVVIVPASFGWALAVQLLEEFEKHPKITKLENEFNERLKDALKHPVHLSLSAGLAIADVKYPVRYLFDLAEGLLKEAKRLARETRTGTLCHIWLRAPVISEHAKVLLEDLYSHNDRVLTARPYTSQQARELTQLARQLSILAKSQRMSLAEAVEKGVHVSLNYALYQAARMSGEGRRQQVIQAFEELGNLIGQSPVGDKFWFWSRKNGSEWRTSLLDALELLELGAEQHLVEKI